MNKGLLKGHKKELVSSCHIHKEGLAFLVDANILRSRGGGQLDIVRIKNNMINIFECKSSRRISVAQLRRINNSAILLSRIVNLPVTTAII